MTATGRRRRACAALHAFAELATAEPHAMSLFLLGAFGAGPDVLVHRTRKLERLQAHIRASRDRAASEPTGDLTVDFIIGGIREVIAARLRQGRASELPTLAAE